MLLKTDYKDDVLDLTQNANRKFQEIENQDGSISFNDVTVYETTGDTFGAADANSITRALTDTTHGVSFQFGIDGNGDYGYIKDGESEVTPFRNRHTETITPSTRTTVDMGEFHKKRYVDLSAVPNVNTQVAYFTQNTGGNYDLGAANNYRYVNVAVNNRPSFTVSVPMQIDASVEPSWTGGASNSNWGTLTVTWNGSTVSASFDLSASATVGVGSTATGSGHCFVSGTPSISY